MSILIENATVISSETVEEKEIWITEGRFTTVCSTIDRRINAQSLFVTPGLIDLQINGFGGIEFGRDIRSLEAAISLLPQYGITAFAPTLPTSPMALYQRKNLEKNLSSVRNRFGAQIVGWHLEGPFINPENCGIHPKQYILNEIDVDFWNNLFASKCVALMTLAPEAPCALPLLDLLHDHHITAAIGHSNPSSREMQIAYERGVRLVTHLFNAMPPFHHRFDNLIGSILGDSLFSATIIADLVHVSRQALRIAYACCPNRLAIVSDACPLIGSQEKQGRFCGVDIQINGQACYELGTQRLAGSALCVQEQLMQAIEALSIPFEKALEMVTSIPASYIGLGDVKGKIEEGYDADCVFWDGYTVVATISRGDLVYAQDKFLHRIRG